MSPSCGERGRLKCWTKTAPDIRRNIVDKSWGMQSITRSTRFYISQPIYRYQRPGSTRSLNHSFYFEVDGHRIKSMQIFFKSTLIIDRPIRTVIAKTENGVTEGELKGCHRNHRRLDESIRDRRRKHNGFKPRNENHYLHAHTREFIEGGKTIANLHRDYIANCTSGLPAAKLSRYAIIFNSEYNLSFFTPKDQWELCTAFGNLWR